MKIIFLGGLFTSELTKDINKNSIGVIQYAANILQWNFIKGFDHFYKTEIISLPFIGSYPLRFKKKRVPSLKFEHRAGANDISLSFFNLPLIKLLYRYNAAKKTLYKYLSKNNELTTIVIYSVHTPFLKAAVKAKVKFPGTKICLIVPDLPEFMSSRNNWIYYYLKKINSKILKKLLNNVDSFILLSKYMKTKIVPPHKPWVRIEGIYDPIIKDYTPKKELHKTIFYSGTLAERYGILNLVNAFCSIKSNNYRLWISGEGNALKEIKQKAKIDTRISYLGQLPHEEVLILQKKATVLVNPRTPRGEYTKYSFPSKTIEYFASKTPSIIYKLPGIPSEYYDYCFVVEKEGIEHLKKMLIHVCEKPQSELNSFGERAAQFIFKNKNPIIQVNKVVNIINNN